LDAGPMRSISVTALPRLLLSDLLGGGVRGACWHSPLPHCLRCSSLLPPHHTLSLAYLSLSPTHLLLRQSLKPIRQSSSNYLRLTTTASALTLHAQPGLLPFTSTISPRIPFFLTRFGVFLFGPLMPHTSPLMSPLRPPLLTCTSSLRLASGGSSALLDHGSEYSYEAINPKLNIHASWLLKTHLTYHGKIVLFRLVLTQTISKRDCI
jgi:hypothetical protein